MVAAKFKYSFLHALSRISTIGKRLMARVIITRAVDNKETFISLRSRADTRGIDGNVLLSSKLIISF